MKAEMIIVPYQHTGFPRLHRYFLDTLRNIIAKEVTKIDRGGFVDHVKVEADLILFSFRSGAIPQELLSDLREMTKEVFNYSPLRASVIPWFYKSDIDGEPMLHIDLVLYYKEIQPHEM